MCVGGGGGGGVCVRGAQLENILELSLAGIRIIVRGGAGLGAGTVQPKSFFISSYTHRIATPPHPIARQGRLGNWFVSGPSLEQHTQI